MPQSTYVPIVITLTIPDKVIGATTVKRKATLTSMIYNQQVGFLSLVWSVEHFAANSDSTYGDTLASFIPNKMKQTTAADTVIVDDATGAFVYPDHTGAYDPAITTIGQYSWFNKLAQNQSLNVHALIEQYGNAVDWTTV